MWLRGALHAQAPLLHGSPGPPPRASLPLCASGGSAAIHLPSYPRGPAHLSPSPPAGLHGLVLRDRSEGFARTPLAGLLPGASGAALAPVPVRSRATPGFPNLTLPGPLNSPFLLPTTPVPGALIDCVCYVGCLLSASPARSALTRAAIVSPVFTAVPRLLEQCLASSTRSLVFVNK